MKNGARGREMRRELRIRTEKRGAGTLENPRDYLSRITFQRQVNAARRIIRPVRKSNNIHSENVPTRTNVDSSDEDSSDRSPDVSPAKRIPRTKE